jgi:hypothetical protein
MDSDKFFLTND